MSEKHLTNEDITEMGNFLVKKGLQVVINELAEINKIITMESLIVKSLTDQIKECEFKQDSMNALMNTHSEMRGGIEEGEIGESMDSVGTTHQAIIAAISTNLDMKLNRRDFAKRLIDDAQERRADIYRKIDKVRELNILTEEEWSQFWSAVNEEPEMVKEARKIVEAQAEE